MSTRCLSRRTCTRSSRQGKFLSSLRTRASCDSTRVVCRSCLILCWWASSCKPFNHVTLRRSSTSLWSIWKWCNPWLIKIVRHNRCWTRSKQNLWTSLTNFLMMITEQWNSWFLNSIKKSISKFHCLSRISSRLSMARSIWTSRDRIQFIHPRITNREHLNCMIQVLETWRHKLNCNWSTQLNAQTMPLKRAKEQHNRGTAWTFMQQTEISHVFHGSLIKN